MPADDRLQRLPRRRVSGGLILSTASGLRARLLGLARLTSLPAGHGLELPRCRSVHTFGMRFALDLLWVDGRGGLLRLDVDVRPRRIRSCRRAASVIEVPAGRGPAWAQALAASDGRPADCSPATSTGSAEPPEVLAVRRASSAGG